MIKKILSVAKLAGAVLCLFSFTMCSQRANNNEEEKELKAAIAANDTLQNFNNDQESEESANSTKSGITMDSLRADNVRIIQYVPTGVCSSLIHIEIDKTGLISNVTFTDGCDGNAKGIGALIKGMKVDEAIVRLDGIKCGKKATSCPDQLSKALKQALSKIK